ncbi:MAG TPA: hypothetical protein VM658_18500 [bacterium]|nr:hypothetical protein [bacterium]
MKSNSMLWMLMMMVALAAMASCQKKEADSVRIVMENKTGQHMTRFKLDYGAGKVEYEIFSRDYTFSDVAPAPAEPHDISVEFYDDAGKFHSFTLERPLSSDMAGGRLYIYFMPGDQQELSMDWR